jgi:hypothetical protein
MTFTLFKKTTICLLCGSSDFARIAPQLNCLCNLVASELVPAIDHKLLFADHEHSPQPSDSPRDDLKSRFTVSVLYSATADQISGRYIHCLGVGIA